MPTTAPTYADFIVAFPAFVTTAQAAIERQLSLSTRLLDPEIWADFYSDAVGLDAAHNLVLDLQSAQGPQGAAQAAVGPVTSVSAAGISTSFATLSPAGKSASQDWYQKTGYGQQFLRLRQVVIPMGGMA